MKKIFLLLLSFVCAGICMAQDVIVKKDGSIIMAKVLKISETEIEYKNFDNQDGPTRSVSISNVMSINYQNGEKEMFNAVTTPAQTSATDQASASASTPVSASASTPAETTEESNFPIVDLSQYHGLLLTKGNCVYVAANSTEEWDQWGVERIKHHLKQLGYWKVVDKPEQAHFIMQFSLRTQGKDFAYIYLRTRKIYEENPVIWAYKVKEPESSRFYVDVAGEEKTKIVKAIEYAFSTTSTLSGWNMFIKKMDNPKTVWEPFWVLP